MISPSDVTRWAYCLACFTNDSISITHSIYVEGKAIVLFFSIYLPVLWVVVESYFSCYGVLFSGVTNRDLTALLMSSLSIMEIVGIQKC